MTFTSKIKGTQTWYSFQKSDGKLRLTRKFKLPFLYINKEEANAMVAKGDKVVEVKLVVVERLKAVLGYD